MNVRIRTQLDGGKQVYHTENCRNYPDPGRDIPIDEAKTRGFEECRYCSGEYEPNDSDPWALHKKLGVDMSPSNSFGESDD